VDLSKALRIESSEGTRNPDQCQHVINSCRREKSLAESSCLYTEVTWLPSTIGSRESFIHSLSSPSNCMHHSQRAYFSTYCCLASVSSFSNWCAIKSILLFMQHSATEDLPRRCILHQFQSEHTPIIVSCGPHLSSDESAPRSNSSRARSICQSHHGNPQCQQCMHECRCICAALYSCT
jgi:hypothetical protein